MDIIPAIFSASLLVRPALELTYHGYLHDCPAPKARCTCEASLYATAGTYAFTAGTLQWLVGYRFSMATLSDAFHAFSDMGANLTGVLIARKTTSDPAGEKRIRTTGNKIIAFLFILGAMFIAHEAHERWNSDSYVVWLPAVIFAGSFGFIIDIIRWRMLNKARGHHESDTLFAEIKHAESDALHSGAIALIALMALCGTFFQIEKQLHHFIVQLLDYLASLGLAGYMTFILAPRIWRGRSCCNKPHSDNDNHH